MSNEITTVGVGVETDKLEKGTRALDKFADEGEKTERRTKRATDSITKSYSSSAKAVDKFKKRLTAAAAVALTFKTLRSVIASNREFQSSLSDLSAITGAAGDDLKYYSDQSKDIGRTTSLSASQAVQAFKLIASAKPDLLDNANALNAVTREAVALAEAAGIDLPEAANALGSSLNQFNVEASESGRFINVLAAGAKFGSSAISDTALALKNSGVAAASAGVSFEQANAAIQVLSASAIKGAEGGTALRNIILKLNTSTDKDLRPSVVGLSQALINLKKNIKDPAEAVKFFGVENITAGQILVNNVAKFNDLTDALTGTSTAYEQAATKLNNLQGDQLALASATEGLAIAFGEKLDPSMRSATQLMTDFIRAVTGQVSNIVLLTKVISGTATAYAGLVTYNYLAAKATGVYSLSLSSVGVSAKSATVGLTTMKGAMMSVLGVAAAFYGGFKLGEFLRKEFRGIRKLGAGIAQGIEQSLIILSGTTKILGAKIKNAFTNPLDLIQAKVVSFLQFFAGLGDRALDFLGLGGMMDGITSKLDSWVPETQQQFDKLLTSIADETKQKLSQSSAIWSQMQKDISSGVDIAGSDVKEFSDLVGEFMSQPVNTSGILSGLENIETSTKKAKKATKDLSTSYFDFGFITQSVLSDLISNSDDAFDNIGETFKKMLLGMVADAAANEITMNFASESSSGDNSSNATSSWWGAIIAAVVTLGNVRNKHEDRKWNKFTSEYRQGVQGTGTILGQMNQKSQSLNESIEDLQSHNIDILDVNYGMLSALIDIRTGLTGVADGFARTGFGSAGSAALSSISTDTTTMNDNLSLDVLHQSSRIFSGINDALGGGFIDPISEALGNFWDGLQNEVAPMIYRTDREITDTGIEVFSTTLASIIDGGLINAQAYADLKEEDKLFGIDIGTEISTTTQDLDGVILNQLSSVFSSAGTALGIAAEQFGIDFGAIAGDLLIEGGRLSLQGLEGDELSAEIESFFSSTLDNWASTVLSGTDVLGDFQQVGEGAFQTISRLATQTAMFSDAADRLNIEFNAIGVNAAYATQRIAEAAGGFDILSGNLNVFSSRFTSDADQLANVTDQLSGVFTELGIDVIPQTHEAFATLVRGALETGEGAEELFASLIALSRPMDEYLTATNRMTQEIDSAADAANRLYASNIAQALEEAVSSTDNALASLRSSIDVQLDKLNDAYRAGSARLNADLNAKVDAAKQSVKRQTDFFKRSIDLVSDSVRNLTSLSASLRSASKANEVESLSINQARRRSAQGGLESALNTARQGGSVGDISGILSTLSQDSGGLFDSFADFAVDSARTAHKMIELADLTDAQLTFEEQNLEALNSQLDSAKINSENVIAKLRENNQAQVDILNRTFEWSKARWEAQYAQAVRTVEELRGEVAATLSVKDAVEQVEDAIIEESYIRAANSTELSDAVRALTETTIRIANEQDAINERIATGVELTAERTDQIRLQA